MDKDREQKLSDVANKLRIHSINMTNASKSGHPTSCCSMAEIMSVLFFNTMKYSVEVPNDPNSDRFVLSKGHAAPILYAAWAEAGLYTFEELLNLRKITSDLEGHPTPKLPYVDVATGSLGQGIGAAAGIAYLGKYIEKKDYKVYCLLGDGEVSEGSVWEAALFSSQHKLNNLIAIVDVNRLAQSDPAPLGHDMEAHRKRWDAFGFNAFVIDGHNIVEVVSAFENCLKSSDKPSVILAKTFKGHGCSKITDKMNWHGKPLGSESEAALAEINGRIVDKNITGKAIKLPSQTPPKCLSVKSKILVKTNENPNYKLGDLVATRIAYGTGLLRIGKACSDIVVLDADVKNSTFADKFKNEFPERFIDCFIAEQNMISVAMGMASRNRTVAFASTFAAFLSRGYDQIRMGAVSLSSVNFCGSHVGVSIGEDGPSQMALEDIAIFRAIPGCTVFYPSDAVSMERAVELAANTVGMAYIRSSRPANPVIYKNEEPFEVGKCKIVMKSQGDNILMIGAGVTLHEIIKASGMMEEYGLKARVIDLFTVKPLDKNGIIQAARECKGHIVTVEDHYIEGGLYDAVCAAMAGCNDIIVKGIAVNGVPRSGSPEELLDLFGISAKKIAENVKNMIF